MNDAQEAFERLVPVIDDILGVLDEDIELVRKALAPKKRFTLTEPSDPDHPGILDAERPNMVAAWDESFVDGEERARDFLKFRDSTILYDLSWNRRTA